MFEALGAQILSGVVSLSILLFSSFQGNDRLSSIKHSKSQSYVYLEAELLSAFDEDFPSILASGTTIPVLFALEVRSGKRIVAKREVINKVSFDPATGVYEVFKPGIASTLTKSLEQVKRELALFEYALPYQSSWGVVNIKLEAGLPKVHFKQMDKELDLMVLWRFKKPMVKAQLDLRQDS